MIPSTQSTTKKITGRTRRPRVKSSPRTLWGESTRWDSARSYRSKRPPTSTLRMPCKLAGQSHPSTTTFWTRQASKLRCRKLRQLCSNNNCRPFNNIGKIFNRKIASNRKSRTLFSVNLVTHIFTDHNKRRRSCTWPTSIIKIPNRDRCRKRRPKASCNFTS